MQRSFFSFHTVFSLRRRLVLPGLVLLLAQVPALRALPGDSVPVITEQPQPQTSFVGANVNLRVRAVSPAYLRYRWRFYGTNLPGNFPGQFTPLLQLREISPEAAGPYSVVVSNSFGAVTSQTAVVTVNEFSGGPGAFINVDAGPGFSLFTQPLWQSEQTVESLLPVVPDGTSLFKLDGNGFIANNYLAGWSMPGMLLTQGEGWFFHNPTTDSFRLTFVGALVEGLLTNHLPAGHSLSASLLPQSGRLSSDLGFPLIPGARAYLFSNQIQNYVGYEIDQNGWQPAEPSVLTSIAFWSYQPMTVDWVRFFEDIALGSYRIVQPRLTHEIGQVNFFTYNTDGVFGRVLDLDGVTPLQSDFLGQLYANTNDLESTLLPVGQPEPFLDGAGAGYVRGGIVTIPGSVGGEYIFLQLRVWEKCAGDTYEQAVFNGSASGRSAIFSAIAHATIEDGGPGLPPANANVFPPFQVSLGNGTPLRVSRTTVNGGDVEICFATQPGWVYCLQQAPSFNEPMAWTPVAGAEEITGTGHVARITYPAAQSQSFYRLCRVR